MADAPFRVDLRPAEGGVHVTLAGELDVTSAPELRHRQSEIVGSPGDVWIDCAELTFADSSGLDALLRLATTLRDQQRRVVVTNARPMVRRAMELLQLTELIELE
jgi:anti-anti-sigma factor